MDEKINIEEIEEIEQEIIEEDALAEEEDEIKSVKLNFDDRTIFDEKGSHKDYHNNDRLDAKKADVNLLIGKRANGKSYSTFTFDCIKRFIDSNYVDQFAYVRRFDNEMALIKTDIFNGPVMNGWLEWYTKGKWNDIYYYRNNWYLRKLDEEGNVEDKCSNPMAYAFCINTAGKAKGPDYYHIETILFDEFIPINDVYCPHEIRLWNNLISTIDRNRNKVKIYMIANTISKNCPHFEYYGIDPDKLEKGKIYVSGVGTKGKLAIEYCADEGPVETTESVYFNTEDEIGAMILGGDWENRKFPSLPENYNLEELTTFKFYLVLRNKIVEGCFLSTPEISTIYFHMYNDLIEPDELVYLDEWYPDAIDAANVFVGLDNHRKIDKVILNKLSENRCYFEDDDTGEKVSHFVKHV